MCRTVNAFGCRAPAPNVGLADPGTPPGWAIRPWGSGDRADLALFKCADPGRPYTRDAQDVIREAAGELSEADARLDCLVAVEDGTLRLVGAILFNPGGPDQFARVQALGVVRDRRRQGIGIALKRGAIVRFAEAGAVEYFSEVHQRNDKMLALNAKLGIRSKREPSNGKFLICANTIKVVHLEAAVVATSNLRATPTVTSAPPSRAPAPERGDDQSGG